MPPARLRRSSTSSSFEGLSADSVRFSECTDAACGSGLLSSDGCGCCSSSVAGRSMSLASGCAGPACVVGFYFFAS